MDRSTIDSEFLRPLCTAWLEKLESAKEARSRWKEVADECMMFYSQSASAMWNNDYSKKFWKGVKLPRFRITINKAFEMVAIYGPNLMWEYPHRTVSPKKPMSFPEELVQFLDPQQQQIVQALQQQQMMKDAGDKVTASMMDLWLNYTPGEQPDGGLVHHSKRAITDSLIKGRGCLASRPYKMPGSDITLTGSFHVDPYDVLTDGDFKSVGDCKWIAIRKVEHAKDVEERYQLPKGTLKGRATLESSWQRSELKTDPMSGTNRNAHKTADLIAYWEIYSKAGAGCSHASMDNSIREHMENVVPRYAYFAICESVPYPLNLPTDKLRSGLTDEEVKAATQWPVDMWRDDRWPVEFLDYFVDPNSAWPIAPLAPGLGELKLLNFLVSWMASRVWSSSRDFWAVAGPHVDHYKEYLLNGDDQSIIPTPVSVEDVRKAVTILTQPETRQDLSKLIAFVSDMFDKRVALTPFMYGLNQDGTQNRTAEETMAKSRAVQARPEYMAKQVADWQSRVAVAEAFVTKRFVTSQDILQLAGPLAAFMWQQFVEGRDPSQIARQFDYSISATSIRRPDRDRDLANYQQVLQYFLGVVQQYGAGSGNYEPFNFLMQQWGNFHDADLSGAMIPPPQPPSEAQQQMEQLTMQELQAKVEYLMAQAQAKQADAQATMVEAQLKPQEMQMQMAVEQMRAQRESSKLEAEQASLGIDMMRQQAELEGDLAQTQFAQQTTLLDMLQDSERHAQEMDQDEERHEQELRQKQEMGKVQIELAKKAAAAKPKPTSGNSTNKPKAKQ
jgi:hypothetical protein